MGPGDPFADPAVRPHPLDAPRPTRVDQAPPPRPPSSTPLVGLLVGLVFGILLITVGLSAALIVGLCAGLGAALGYAVHGARSGHFDLTAAWRALRRDS